MFPLLSLNYKKIDLKKKWKLRENFWKVSFDSKNFENTLHGLNFTKNQFLSSNLYLEALILPIED